MLPSSGILTPPEHLSTERSPSKEKKNSLKHPHFLGCLPCAEIEIVRCITTTLVQIPLRKAFSREQNRPKAHWARQNFEQNCFKMNLKLDHTNFTSIHSNHLQPLLLS
jgi:hypothetical protein